MAVLGESIELDPLVSGAHDMVMIKQVSPDALACDPKIYEFMKHELGALARYILPTERPFFAFGDHFLGMSDVYEDIYDDSLSGEAAGVAGWFCGLRIVELDNDIELKEGLSTRQVPAVQIRTVEVELESELSLGMGQLYPKVAVPLLGHTATAFWCEGMTWANTELN